MSNYYFSNHFENPRSADIAVVLTASVSGLISHGVMLTSKYSFFDDINYMYSTGNTYPEDRWGLGILSWVVDKVGLGNYSLPIFQGMLCIVFLAIISILIVKMLDIKSIVGTVLIPVLMTAFPALTITFCYMFTSSYYMFGLLLMTGGVFLAGKYNSIKAYVVALILCTLSLSIYQAYLPFGLSLCLIYLIGCILNHNKNQQLVKKIIAFAATFVSSVVMYFLAAIACRKILNIKNDGYKGIEGNYILTAFRGIFYKIRLAYKAFIIPLSGESIPASDLFPEALRLFLYLTVILFLVMTAIAALEIWKSKQYWEALALILLTVIFPVTVEFIYIMTSPYFVYGIMKYSEVMPFILLVLYSDRMIIARPKLQKGLFLPKINVLFISLSCLLFCKLDNICYLKIQFIQSEAISYYTTLISRIESTAGYKEDYQIAFIEGQKKEDTNWAQIPELDLAALFPIDWKEIINDNSWIDYMRYWCGFEPRLVDNITMKNLQKDSIVKMMPCYPDDGSISVINDTVVVKFADFAQ